MSIFRAEHCAQTRYKHPVTSALLFTLQRVILYL